MTTFVEQLACFFNDTKDTEGNNVILLTQVGELTSMLSANGFTTAFCDPQIHRLSKGPYRQRVYGPALVVEEVV